MQPQEPADSDNDAEGDQSEHANERPFHRRIWANDSRELEEAKDLWERMSQFARFDSYISDDEERFRAWTTIKEDIEKGWRVAPKSRRYNVKTGVKVLRGVVDENSFKGGKIVFAKEA